MFHRNEKVLWNPPPGEGTPQEVRFLNYNKDKTRARILTQPNLQYLDDDGLRWVFVERIERLK